MDLRCNEVERQLWAEHVDLALPRPTRARAAMTRDRFEPKADIVHITRVVKIMNQTKKTAIFSNEVGHGSSVARLPFMYLR